MTLAWESFLFADEIKKAISKIVKLLFYDYSPEGIYSLYMLHSRVSIIYPLLFEPLTLYPTFYHIFTTLFTTYPEFKIIWIPNFYIRVPYLIF